MNGLHEHGGLARDDCAGLVCLSSLRVYPGILETSKAQIVAIFACNAVFALGSSAILVIAAMLVDSSAM
jgi:hypothetical protein